MDPLLSSLAIRAAGPIISSISSVLSESTTSPTNGGFANMLGNQILKLAEQSVAAGEDFADAVTNQLEQVSPEAAKLFEEHYQKLSSHSPKERVFEALRLTLDELT